MSCRRGVGWAQAMAETYRLLQTEHVGGVDGGGGHDLWDGAQQTGAAVLGAAKLWRCGAGVPAALGAAKLWRCGQVCWRRMERQSSGGAAQVCWWRMEPAAQCVRDAKER